MKIAILGGGHGAYAAAADLSEAGHEVRLWRRDAAALESVIRAGAITLKDAAGTREVPLALATPDIADALRGAELIVVPTPAIAQHDIALEMAPHLADGQVVFLPPGTFGSFVMARTVAQAGSHADVAWAETGTLPYLARKHGEREVNLTIRAVRLPTGVYPARKATEAIAVIRKAYPSVHGCGDALSGALMNAGPVIHPPLMVMNAAPLQHFERWDIHNEGTQRAVRDVTDRLDQERIAVREAFGQGAPHYPLADHYNNERWMYGDAHKQLVKSGDWRENIDLYAHRYVTEDTELGLAFLASAARYAGVDAPIAHGLLAIVGGFLGRDLRLGERTFETLGLAELTPAQLTQRLHDGE
ncbi:NAD/NADP octopine/nopaline dehydrogenase family protein [Variovorax sp. J22G21]|uniref:NAD/NADP-dependent octopine/nopaline dehydrogenase family protein n=1 Tax=Variovorax fucosicus TaxID=3053517 RepID=UPI002574BC0F|nr:MULTISPECIES: NAD/NADP-dependent octopine/nopaline dehydrogenase family protein [unclassified Variovorax]MDM0041762.1 NAD/NADP octopine/nopaline dehydrogenase family protein [Variovorax sp. J22R193]MDM0059601.1 NAD/NADP octopine/nopaline dehydrogenase family protein [Variovorax sp. J22G21]